MTVKLTREQFAIVDAEDFKKINTFKWHCTTHNYAFCKKLKTYMHRFIMPADQNFKIDHKNGNGLDNRKSNLRICTQSENGRHRIGLNKNNKSGHRGVVFDKQRDAWRAEIMVNGRNYFLCRSKDQEIAILTRMWAADLFHGEFSGVKND